MLSRSPLLPKSTEAYHRLPMDFQKEGQRPIRVHLTNGTLVHHVGSVEESEGGEITIRNRSGENLSTFLPGEFTEWFYDDTEV